MAQVKWPIWSKRHWFDRKQWSIYIGIRNSIIPGCIIKQKLDVEKSILFTFDDGPHPDITRIVLDILDENNAKGLFFIPGNRIKRAPKILNEIIDRKHWIGNHSYSHTSCSNLSFGQIISEINQCKDELLSQTGLTTKFYRPPMGAISPSLLFAAWHCKHKIIRWSLESGEYSYMRNATSSALADIFLKNVHDRAIVLCHDDKKTTPEFLRLVLPKLVKDNFDLRNGLLSLGGTKRL